MDQASHDSLSWLDMIPAEFDASAASRKERKFIAEAPATLFPRLLPESSRKAQTAPAQLDGQDALFGDQP